MTTPSVAIVMPAYNEEARIGETFDAIAQYVATHECSLPIYLADDGSTDRTTGVAWAAGERLGLDLHVLRLPHRGKALTVRDAMIAAASRSDAEYLLMLDADNEVSIEHLNAVDWAVDPKTVYIARRIHDSNGKALMSRRPFRRLMSAGMRIASRVLLDLPYRDTQCGFKLIPRRLAFELFAQQRSSGWVFDAEILVIARQSALPIREIPVEWQPRGESRVGRAAALSSVAALLGIAFRYRTGQYKRVGPPRKREPDRE